MDFSKIEECRDEEKPSEERLVFHYNREERLKHAPQIVQDYYSGSFKAYKGGLFKSLVNTKANRFLFVTIIFAFGIIMFVNFFGPQKRSGSVAGVDANLSAFSYEDAVYASLQIETAGKKKIEKFTGGVPVTVSFTAYDKDNVSVYEDKLIGKYDGNELFLRTTFKDYDIIKVVAICSMLDSISSLETTIEKR